MERSFETLIPPEPVTDAVTAAIPVQFIAALVGTSFFAVLFGVPRKFYFAAGLVGVLGWMVYILMSRYTPMGDFGSTFLAATMVAFLSRYAAIKLKCPSTVFLICGIFPLIPGAGVFWSAYYIASTQLESAIMMGLSSVKLTLAIVLGIIVAANVFHSSNWQSKYKEVTVKSLDSAVTSRMYLRKLFLAGLVSLIEHINSSGGVDNLHLTGIERVRCV